MISIFLMLALLLPVILGFGKIFHYFFGTLFTGLSSLLLSGISSLAILFTLLSFFIPLNLYVEMTTIIIGLSAFFFFKIYDEIWKFFTKVHKSFFLIALTPLFFGSYYPFILDHFGYYVPTIKWISEVGLVQGISNFDLILGQMSIWHIFQAGFSHFSDPYFRINVLVLITYLLYLFEKKSFVHLLFFPVLFLFLQSPSPDLPVIVISLILLHEFLTSNKNAALLFALSAFVFALKPTMIWLPLFAFLYGIFILKSNLKFIIPAILILLLFFFKNIWTFGFPVFPVQLIDFGFSWKPNPALLKNSAEMAILKTYDLQYSISEIAKFSTIDYIKNWLLLDGIKGVIHQFFILSLIIFFLFSLKRNSKIIWLIFISIFIKSVLVILFSAQYRFFIDVFFVIFFVLFYQNFSKKTSLIAFATLTLFCGIFLSFPNLVQHYLPSFKLGKSLKGYQKKQWFQPAHYELQKFKTYKIGNLKFNVVKNYPFIFDTSLPAISPAFIKEYLDAGIFPQLKGSTLKEGFIWRKISEKEKRTIEIILKEQSKPSNPKP